MYALRQGLPSPTQSTIAPQLKVFKIKSQPTSFLSKKNSSLLILKFFLSTVHTKERYDYWEYYTYICNTYDIIW